MLEMTEHSFDAIAIPVAAEVTRNGLAPVGFRRDDREDAAHQQVFADGVTIILLVGKQRFWWSDRQRHEAIEGAVVGRFAAC